MGQKGRSNVRLPSVFAIASVLLATASAAQVPGPAPRFDAWKIIGPGGGGTMIAPTISPHDPRVVVEYCDMTGGYITQDGGESWRMFNLRAGIETFAFDPSNPKRIYAGNAALWRSDDTGQTWRMLFPNPAKKTVEHRNGDHGDYSLTSDDGNYVTGLLVRQIVVDPSDSNIVHIAFSDPQNGGTTLLVSKDNGVSFHYENEYPSERILLLLYTGSSRLAIGTQGVYRGRAETAKPITGSGEKIAHASLGEAEARTIVFVTTDKGNLFVSEDNGGTWQRRTPALGQQSGEFGAVSVAAHNGLIAYAGFRSLKLGGHPEDIYNGIAKTTDAGKSWSIVFRESTQAASNLDASWIDQRAVDGGTDASKNIFFAAPYSLGVAPGNPDICYATDLFRTYQTLDGGKTWAQVNSARIADNRWTTRGLDVTTNYGMQFDPFDAKHVFIDYTDIGAFQSYDGGQSWESATNGIPDRWRNTTYWLAFDPEVKGLMWGAFSGIHDLPRPKMWRRGGFRDRAKGGVGISTDGGRTWTPSNSGMEEAPITYVLLDPASPVGQRTLYACGFGMGVYKSTDNGKTWQLKNDGIKEMDPFAWRMVLAGDGALYLIMARGNEGLFGDASGSGALYKSLDGAEHWEKLRLPEGVDGPNGLALDPRDNRRMYLAAWGQEREGVDANGGVFLSTDGGASWKPMFSQSQHVYDVTIDPKAPDTLYICGFDAAAYRSTDAGLHWTRIRGYNFEWGHRVIIDPNDVSKIYITTYGGSVWHGPAAGDPSAPEDTVSPLPAAQ
jgi:photosystem II stability/assembly factor-like uncharacterized protein